MSHISVRALRVRVRVIVCIRLSGVANRKLAKKWPKIVTAAHLSNDNSKTKGVSTLNQAYPSEGVFYLNLYPVVTLLLSKTEENICHISLTTK